MDRISGSSSTRTIAGLRETTSDTIDFLSRTKTNENTSNKSKNILTQASQCVNVFILLLSLSELRQAYVIVCWQTLDYASRESR